MNNQFLLTLIFTIINIILIIINYIFNRKNAHTNYYSNILANKLSLLYSPLYTKIDKKDYYLTQDKIFIDNFYKYSYLLENYLCNFLVEIINTELLIKDIHNFTDKSTLLKKHEIQLETLSSIIKNNYKKDTSIYRNTYKKIEEELSLPSLLRLGVNIFDFCFYFFIFALIVIYIASLNGTEKIDFTNPMEILKRSSLTILSLGFFFSIFKFIFFISELKNTKNLKTRKKYKSYHLVPDDGYYICTCCNQKRYFYKYQCFMRCPNKKNPLKISSYQKAK
ncbi:hypothetical protein KYB31_07920 [Clostridium felsineum]|uniref:hypothetical protein n=1 Tax=Clostridium felsineum TaxID=36839 RepID=UPI00214DE136|nr:hypothetical protein [Clostridium felsineum]MCR3758916.1 hypothetical protein [Clostridium felsineum]